MWKCLWRLCIKSEVSSCFVTCTDIHVNKMFLCMGVIFAITPRFRRFSLSCFQNWIHTSTLTIRASICTSPKMQQLVSHFTTISKMCPASTQWSPLLQESTLVPRRESIWPAPCSNHWARTCAGQSWFTRDCMCLLNCAISTNSNPKRNSKKTRTKLTRKAMTWQVKYFKSFRAASLPTQRRTARAGQRALPPTIIWRLKTWWRTFQ